MKFYKAAFVLFLIFIQVVNGLVYAGYKTPPKVAGISLLDRHRCGEMYLGFEFTGYMISADGSCVGIIHDWSGAISVDSELIQKSWNCNLFKIPLVLFRESDANYNEFNTQIPGDVTTGSRVEVVFEPKDPWNQIVLNFMDEDEIDAIFHVSFRKDYGKIQLNSRISGNWGVNNYIDELIITTGIEATLTLEVLADAIKISVNGIEKYRYSHLVVEPEKTRRIDFYAYAGSNCLLKSICFYDLKTNA